MTCEQHETDGADCDACEDNADVAVLEATVHSRDARIAELEAQLETAQIEDDAWTKRWGYLRNWLKATGPFYTTNAGYGDLTDVMRSLEGKQ